MELNIENLRMLCDSKSVMWREHALKRMRERNIKKSDVINCIKTGEIIEQYPEDYPHPSCLVFGFDNEKFILHAVCSDNDCILWIITAYYPNNIKWQDDYKTRKVVKL
ncbi:MAG: DUF4258 domain-containing protein [Clostridia bacterium]